MQGDNDQLASFWMPFTANRSYKAHPRQLVAASGMYYQSGDGRRILGPVVQQCRPLPP